MLRTGILCHGQMGRLVHHPCLFDCNGGSILPHSTSSVRAMSLAINVFLCKTIPGIQYSSTTFFSQKENKFSVHSQSTCRTWYRRRDIGWCATANHTLCHLVSSPRQLRAMRVAHRKQHVHRIRRRTFVYITVVGLSRFLSHAWFLFCPK